MKVNPLILKNVTQLQENITTFTHIDFI